MDDTTQRRRILDDYLRSQQMQTMPGSAGASASTSTSAFHPSTFQTPVTNSSTERSLVRVTEVSNDDEQDALPDNISIEDFSNLVKKWIELDNWIKKSQELIRQKRKAKDKISEIITHYMCRYNIEDVNTSEGKIRCKVRYVKSGVNQKVVKEKISEVLKDNEETCNALITKIFDERDKVERVSLRRIRIT
jgi:hypothetical protein